MNDFLYVALPEHHSPSENELVVNVWTPEHFGHFLNNTLVRIGFGMDSNCVKCSNLAPLAPTSLPVGHDLQSYQGTTL